MSSNPFFFGDPVHGADFFDRRRTLRRLAGRIHHGSSALVTGEPRIGKTSVLHHLEEQAAELFGAEARRMVFHYLDCQTLSGQKPEDFWRGIFAPLARRWQAVRRVWESGRFDMAAWESVFAAMERKNQRFVLLLDELDALQNEAYLHNRAVYAMLRSLASRYRSFSLIMASRQSVTDLNSQAREFAAGSPFFNFAQEIILPPLPQKDVTALLARAGARFTPQDKVFLQRIAGRHPYFLQAAAYYLWDWYEEIEEPQLRYEKAAGEFYAAVGENVLADIWGRWTAAMQIAFALVGLNAAPQRLENRSLDLKTLLKNLPDFSPELRKLTQRGFLQPNEVLQSGYAPQAEVMLWYLADELKRSLRDKTDLAEMLRRQQWDGLLKEGEKDALRRLLRQSGDWLAQGAQAFIVAAAQAAAKSYFA